MIRLLPYRVEKRPSAINGTVEVWRWLNQFSLRVAGLTQSGGLIKDIWGKALKTVHSYQPASPAGGLPVNRVLILGLGGGTAAKLVTQLWPTAQVVGVEIDPVMVDLGKKYLNLSEINQLTIVKGEAEAVMKTRLKGDSYQLILVDLFLGRRVINRVYQTGFWKLVKTIKAKAGVIVVNLLKNAAEADKNQRLIERLGVEFEQVKLVKTPANRLLLLK